MFGSPKPLEGEIGDAAFLLAAEVNFSMTVGLHIVQTATAYRAFTHNE